MKGKFGIAALIFSSIAFAAPVSTPNQMSDTPIISGRGTVSSGTCRAYQTDGTAVPLSGGETLVFYGGGTEVSPPISSGARRTSRAAGGFLSTKTTYSGTAYVQVRGRATGFCQDRVCWQEKYCWDGGCDDYGCWSGGCHTYTRCDYTYGCTHGSGIGLFARNTTDKNDFIAGAGGAYGSWETWWRYHVAYTTPAHGGGWQGEPSFYFECETNPFKVAIVHKTNPSTIYSGTWFGTDPNGVQGFHGGGGGGAASSISAFYNSYTKNYTSVGSSLTITGGGAPGVDTPVLYVCK